MKKVFLILAIVCAVFMAAGIATAQAAPTYRALLIACDDYEGKNSDLGYGPIGDATIMQQMLTQPGPTQVKSPVLLQNVNTEAIQKGIDTAFKDAKDGDVSIFFYSGHGFYNLDTGICGICPTNSTYDERLPMASLELMLRKIPGTVVLILDSCHSGGAVNKGSTSTVKAGSANAAEAGSDFATATVDYFKSVEKTSKSSFQRSKYKVLAAAHDLESALGLQFFSTFSASIGIGGGLTVDRNNPKTLSIKPGVYAADTNANGVVTLSEMYEWLKSDMPTTNAASNPQIYPEDDKFALVSYNAQQASRVNPVIGLAATPVTNALSAKIKVTLSLKVRASTSVTVQIYEQIYDQKNERLIYLPCYTLASGKSVSPGTSAFEWDGKVNKDFKLISTTYMAVATPKTGAPVATYFTLYEPEELSIELMTDGDTFAANGQNELRINVYFENAIDSEIQVDILNSAKKSIVTLAKGDITSIFGNPFAEEMNLPFLCLNSYAWNGRLANGSLAPKGTYFVQAQAKRGGLVSKPVMQQFTVVDASQAVYPAAPVPPNSPVIGIFNEETKGDSFVIFYADGTFYYEESALVIVGNYIVDEKKQTLVLSHVIMYVPRDSQNVDAYSLDDETAGYKFPSKNVMSIKSEVFFSGDYRRIDPNKNEWMPRDFTGIR